MKRKCALLLFIFGLLSPGIAAALGLGGLTLKSYLNEPLSAEVKLLEIGNLDPTQIKVRLATREDFARAGVERAYFLTSLKFEVVDDGAGGAKLLVTSSDPVREPYLDFIVEARWPTGRLLREYTILLDPPVFVGDEKGITARAAAPGRDTAQQQARPEPSYAETGEVAAPEPRRMPQRNYGSDALDMPLVGEKYMVVRGDTLWEIATSANPDGSTVQQTMLDILRLNQEAFINDNINQLKAGYVLRLPTASEITLTFEDAVAEVERQTRRWQSGESAVDTRLDASEGLDVSGVAGSDSGDGHLQIAGVDSGEQGGAGGDVSARMEDVDRVLRENDDLLARLSDMEEQLEMQERLITLKDEQIAALQDALEKAGEDADAAMDIQEGTIEPLDMSGLESEAAAEVSEPTPPAEPEAAPEAQPEPKPAPKPAPPPPPPPEPTIVDLIMENIIYVGAGAAVLLLLLILLLRRKSSRGADDGLPFAAAGGDEDDFADVSLSEDSLLVDEFDEEEAEQQLRMDRPEPVSAFSSSDDDAYAAQFETGDALAEADIYIAYGRFPQAVDLLKAAIAVEPANTDYRIKLMEACVEMVESGEFQQQYADLQVIGDDNVLQRARALLEAVDGGESWLEDLPEPSISPEDVAEASQAAAAAQPRDTDLGGELPDLDLEPEGSVELDLGDEEPGALDEDEAGLDLDLDDTDLGVDVERELSGSDDEGVDFDLDEEPEPEEIDLAPEVELEPALEAEDSSDDLGDVALPDLEYEDLTGDVEEEAGESSDEDLLSDLDELDLGLEDEPEAESDLEDVVSLEDDGELDLSDLASDLDLDEEPAAAEPEDSGADLEAMADELVNGSELDGAELDSGDDSDDDLASMELDMSSDGSPEEEGLVFAADGDEIATKLDLARAYIDMGDEEGARGILEEVLDGGNENQQKEARSLLEGIG